jgi:hypothetical protein
MKNKKVVIIGGGVIGFITANYLLSKGIKDISIYELKNNVGGVLKDEIIKNDFFLNSCQYLDVYSEYYKYIPKKIKKSLYEFDHKYFSITKFKDKEIFTKDFAGPVFEEKPIYNKNVNLNDSLLKRLNTYPVDVGFFLISWAKSAFENIHKLTGYSSNSLALRRVFFKNFVSDVKKNKKIKYIDDTHGIPRDALKLSSLKAALPKRGFNYFFLTFEKYLINLGVHIYKKSPIKVLFSKNKIDIFTGSKKINYDYLVWTGNPTSIIKNTTKKILDSFNVKSVNYYFNIKKDIKKNFYIQVFSLDTKINRIFFYYNGNSSKVTVECFEHNLDPHAIQKDVLKYLKYLNLKIKNGDIKFSGHAKYKNYNIISKNDFQTLNNFKKIQDKLQLIDCGWDIYGRDKKLKNVFESINKHILN